MKMRVISVAEQEFAAAVDYYNKQRAGLIPQLRSVLHELTSAGSLLSDAVMAKALALAGEGE